MSFCNICRSDKQLQHALMVKNDDMGASLLVVYERLEQQQEHRLKVILDGDADIAEPYEVADHTKCLEAIDNAFGDIITGDSHDDFRLIMARELGMPEPILYPQDQPTKFDFSFDEEKILNQIVDLQDRMAKGMTLIEESNGAIAEMFSKARWMGILYNCWSGKEKDEAKRRRFLNDPRNTVAIRWFERRKKLWAHWNLLKEECGKLTSEHSYIWAKYFQLKELVLDPYWSTINPERIDTQQDLFDEMMTDRVQGEMHVFQMTKEEEGEYMSRYEEMTYQPFKGKRPVRDDTSPLD